MVDKKEVSDESKFFSSQISSQIRAIALGIIITIWGLFLSNGKDSGFAINLITKIWALRVALFSLFILLFDYLQYLFGYRNASSLQEYMNNNELEKSKYTYESPFYKFAVIFFWIKQVLLIPVIICFVILVIKILDP